jgi:translation initiation factor 5B
MYIAYGSTFRSREKAGQTVEPNKTASVNVSDDEGASFAKPTGGFSSFSAFADTQDVEAFDEDEGGGGGLMVRESTYLLI